MRLLLVATVPITLRSFLLSFASHFRAQGWVVDAMAQDVSACPECVEAFDQVWDVTWSRNPLNTRNMLQAPRIVREIVKRERYDLIHVHMAVAAFVTRYAVRDLRRHGQPKVVYTPHGFQFYQGGPFLRNILFLYLEKLAGRWTDFLVVMNREELEAVRRHNIVPLGNTRYMPGIGVDTSRCCPETVSSAEVERVRTEIGLGPEDKLFLMIAELIPRKRHSDILRAFAQLAHPAAHLAFAGDGRLRERMQRLTADLRIGSRVHFLGFREDVPSLIRASVATLLPSEREGLPRSVMESLSLAVPVIGTDICGVRDLLSDGSGLLVKLGDIAGLARAMAWVLDHPEEAKAMSQHGRARMVATHDVRHILALHEQLYSETLGDWN